MVPRRLRVCFPVIKLSVGGAERQLIELAAGLDPSRFQAYVVPLYRGGRLESELSREAHVKLFHLHRKSKYDVGILYRLVRFLQKERIDIIQPFLTPATFFGLVAALLARTPIKIVTERCGLRKNTHLGNRLYRFVEDRLATLADVVIPNSESGRKYLLNRGIPNTKIKVIYNGINGERLGWEEGRLARVLERLGPPGSFVLGTIASLSPAKDHHSLLRAVAQVKRHMPGIRLALVGDGPLRGELEAEVRALGLEEEVVFFGNQQRIGEFLRAFDVAVLASVDHEGCSNFLLEAMAVGKAVVATDIGGNGELVRPGENGLLVPPGQPEALATAMVELLAHPEKRGLMGSRGMAEVKERFSLAAMVKQYEQVYLDLGVRKGLRVPVCEESITAVKGEKNAFL